MSDPRKKSPRAPSLALGDAIERTAKIYKQEGRHATPVEVVANHIGYSSARNGAALSALASLRYYGLVERPKEGQLAVVKEFETYTYSQDERMKRNILIAWLKTPPIFAELLDKYKDRLPSDGNIKFDLIQRGFIPSSADACVTIFRRSVEDARYFESDPGDVTQLENAGEIGESITETTETSVRPQSAGEAVSSAHRIAAPSPTAISEPDNVDRIPVRLAGGRRAILEIPTPFYAADKKRLKAHIDLLLTDDEDILEGQLNE